MMVGMMLPTVVLMILLDAGIARKAVRQGRPVEPVAVFAGGGLTM